MYLHRIYTVFLLVICLGVFYIVNMQSELTQYQNSVEDSFQKASRNIYWKSLFISIFIILLILASIRNQISEEDRFALQILEEKIANRVRLSLQEKRDYINLLWKVKGIRLFNCETNHIKEIGTLTGYSIQKNDLDWRGKGKSLDEAIEEAFRRTGVPLDKFHSKEWAKDKLGKSRVVEWISENGAEVNIDAPHEINGPDVFHIGYQSEGKNRIRGHIFMDCLPYFREVK